MKMRSNPILVLIHGAAEAADPHVDHVFRSDHHVPAKFRSLVARILIRVVVIVPVVVVTTIIAAVVVVLVTVAVVGSRWWRCVQEGSHCG